MTVMLTNPNFDPVAERTLREHGYEVVVAPRLGIGEEELIELINGNDVVATYSRVERLTRRVIESCPGLRVMVQNGAGVDNIDVEAATERDIQVINLPEGPRIPVAEHTMAFLFALSRDLFHNDKTTRAGKWLTDQPVYRSVIVEGKTLLIVGCGNIGACVAKKAQGVGLVVKAHDPFRTREELAALGVEKVESLHAGLGQADYVSVHTYMSGENRHLIGAPEFAAMKNTAFFLNLSRGPVVDEKAFYQALVSGQIAGGATDVFEEEPAVDNPLFELDNVIVSPHLAGSSVYGMRDQAVMGVTGMMNALEGKGGYNLYNRKALEERGVSV